MPHPGVSWRPRGQPATQPHEYIRGGTTKILTLFHPASGQVRLQPAARCTNAVLHPWLRERLSAILAEVPPPVPSQDPAADASGLGTAPGFSEAFWLGSRGSGRHLPLSVVARFGFSRGHVADGLK